MPTMEQSNNILTQIFPENAYWLVPLVATIIFSTVNVIFAIINAYNAREQRKLQQLNIRFNLLQKRMDIFQKEKMVLESLIDNEFPSPKQLTDLCHAQHESHFLFDIEVENHIEKVCNLAISFDENGGLVNDEIFDDLYMKESSEKATKLFADAISIYSKYLDFCNVGIITEKANKKR